ncbi:flagellar hook-length control protein FliK, partial [Campylobacter cuniculorum]
KDSKKDSKENLKENKANFDTKLNQTMEKNENVSKIPFSKESKENSTFDSLFTKDLKSENTEDLNANHTHKDSTDELHSLVKDLSKTSQNQVKNPINTKETLQYFSQDLKEALEQYKAPITRLNITLNPSNLGEVEVTLVQRGNNLHINFNSNTNAMNLFIQNQAEFKNSLVNMGFTGLEMNFSDQNKKEQNSGQGKNKSGLKNLENADDSKVNLELVLAKYF